MCWEAWQLEICPQQIMKFSALYCYFRCFAEQQIAMQYSSYMTVTLHPLNNSTLFLPELGVCLLRSLWAWARQSEHRMLLHSHHSINLVERVKEYQCTVNCPVSVGKYEFLLTSFPTVSAPFGPARGLGKLILPKSFLIKPCSLKKASPHQISPKLLAPVLRGLLKKMNLGST